MRFLSVILFAASMSFAAACTGSDDDGDEKTGETAAEETGGDTGM